MHGTSRIVESSSKQGGTNGGGVLTPAGNGIEMEGKSEADPEEEKLKQIVRMRSQLGQDLVLSCLKWIPEERVTAANLLKHEFFRPRVAQDFEAYFAGAQ